LISDAEEESKGGSFTTWGKEGKGGGKKGISNHRHSASAKGSEQIALCVTNEKKEDLGYFHLSGREGEKKGRERQAHYYGREFGGTLGEAHISSIRLYNEREEGGKHPRSTGNGQVPEVDVRKRRK